MAGVTSNEPPPRSGREVSRVEGFSDAVFGFALTLLVVSLEVPAIFADLKAILSGFFPFGLMFALSAGSGTSTTRSSAASTPRTR